MASVHWGNTQAKSGVFCEGVKFDGKSNGTVDRFREHKPSDEMGSG